MGHWLRVHGHSDELLRFGNQQVPFAKTRCLGRHVQSLEEFLQSAVSQRAVQVPFDVFLDLMRLLSVIQAALVF
jgi:hypothetical protein